jgi:hypothetical protein
MRPRAEVTLLALGLALGAAHAGDGFAWDPGARPTYKVGQRFEEALDVTDSSHQKFTSADGATAPRDLDVAASVRLLHQVAEVTSGVSEDRIHVERWSQGVKGRDPDTTLEGALVTLKGAAPYRSSSVETQKTLSRDARAWVEHHLVKGGAGDTGLAELDWTFILPRAPVPDGGEWSLDIDAMARELLPPRTEIDPRASRAMGKLTNVHLDGGAHMGHVEVSIDLVQTTMGLGKVSWTEGGVRQFRYVLDLSLEPGKRDLVAGVITTTLKGKGTVEVPDKPPYDVELDESSKIVVKRAPIE